LKVFLKLVLGPVFVSGDATAETLALFLSKVKMLVEKTAARLINGKLIFISNSKDL